MDNALFAIQRGELRHGDRMEDLSEPGIADRVAALRSFAAEAAALEDGASLDDQVTLAVVQSTADGLASWLGPREELYLPNHTIGLHTILWTGLPRQPYRTAEHGDNAVARYTAIGPMLDQLTDRAHTSAARGWTPHAYTVARTIEHLDAYLATPVADDRLAAAQAPTEHDQATASEWRGRLRAALAESVRPAMSRYRDALRDVVAPAARPDAEPGLCWMEGGPELYEARIRSQTTLAATAEQIHSKGLDLVAGLDDEYRELGGKVLGTSDLAEVYTQLRESPELRYTDGAELVKDAEVVVARAAAAMSAAFHRSPQAGCIVTQTDVGAAAFYRTPAKDGSQPGTFFINTADPGSWGRFEIEALSFHEAIPGHHFERALAQEREGLPEVRASAPISAYSEGWALYTERLADEMGLYSSDLTRMGMLATDSLRATRLVVDTGMHAMGWSRRRAIDYMVDNSPITPGHAADEVDRYLGMPGQALSYMMGRLEIVRLRREAEARLGERFDLKSFHDEVLRFGTMPLPMLAKVMAAWVG